MIGAIFIIGGCLVAAGVWQGLGLLMANATKRHKDNNADEPNVNELDFDACEYLAGVIGEDVQTDYQLKGLARYRLLKGKKVTNVKKDLKDLECKDESTLPKGFTIEYLEYNNRYYPKYEKKYLYKIYSIHLKDSIGNMDVEYVPSSEQEAREIIQEYYSVYLGNATKTIIR